MDITGFPIKPAFAERYRQLTDWDAFLSCSLTFLRKSIRVNTLKIPVAALRQRMRNWRLTPIPWCPEAFWVEHAEGRRDIGNTLEHQLGYIYVQEAASLIPPLALDPQPGEAVLDMCASPGSKTTQMAAMMQNKGALVANDYTGIRIKPLGINLQRCGVSNAIVTIMHGRRFRNLQFDKILVDAPCSGTGTISKSPKTLIMWNPHMVKHLAIVQRQLLAAAFQNLRPGGTLVYSTCTMEPEEDEGVVDAFLQQHSDARLEEIALPGLQRSPCMQSFGGKAFHPDIQKCLRIWPQDNRTEGFFVAKIRKG
ncbi:MAG TPA: RsmB/NOP family class I SAM-dependent RNA methyltransferase [Candidatus Nanoarchaeia archaeon]|nr:RsmB/NOP family class I SAM-dependent RNA methyltransferase [Candidatus Nanoarchaeia archaeon]